MAHYIEANVYHTFITKIVYAGIREEVLVWDMALPILTAMITTGGFRRAMSIAKQIAIEKRFLEQRDVAAALVEKRQEQAVKALELGNEELARKALQDKKDQQEKADTYDNEYDKSKAMADDLRHKLEHMKDEFMKMKSKREMLVARADAAKVQKQINHTMGNFGTESAARGFSRMEEKVNQLEAEAEASNELRTSSKSLDDEFKQLGTMGLKMN